MLRSNYCNSTESQKYDKEMFVSVCVKDPVEFVVFYLLLLFAITIINIIGNSLVISTLVRHSKLHQPANYYITSLAVSDLFAGLVYTVYNLSHIESIGLREILGEWTTCSFLLWVVQGFQFTSAYHLVGITASRYILVTNPLLAPRCLTAPTVAISLVLIWTVPNLVSAGLYMAFTPKDNYPDICRYELIYTMWHIFGTLIFAAIVPFAIMLVLYLRIANIARKQAKMISAQEVACSHDRHSKRIPISSIARERKSTKMVAMLLGFFSLGWIPFCVFVIVRLGCKTCIINIYIRAICRLLLHMNSAVNIFIYAGRLSQFRTALRKDLVRMLLCLNVQPCSRVSQDPTCSTS